MVNQTFLEKLRYSKTFAHAKTTFVVALFVTSGYYVFKFGKTLKSWSIVGERRQAEEMEDYMYHKEEEALRKYELASTTVKA